MNMQINAKALVRSHLDTRIDFPELSKRELELVNYALRFCPVENVIQRIDASGKREAYRQLDTELI